MSPTSLLLMLLFLAAPAGTPSSTGYPSIAQPSVPMEIGVHVPSAGAADYDPAAVFCDLMKHARPWGTGASTQTGGEEGPGNGAASTGRWTNVDAVGWPTADFNVVFSVSGSYPNVVKAGTYALSFNGQATITPGPNVVPGITVTNQVYVSGTNTTTANVVASSAGGFLGLISL